MLHVLVELSRIQNRKSPDFLIIGALPLLMYGYLRYTALWDIDLLFRNSTELQEFAKRSKSPTIRIVDYDDMLMVSESITSYHTAWTSDKNWLNVDYILRRDLFEFHADKLTNSTSFNERIAWNGSNYDISLFLAHPWDIIASKVLSPRTTRDISLRVDTSIDIRHIFAVYKVEKDNMNFWRHVVSRGSWFCPKDVFRKKFLELLRVAHELGYENLEISPLAMEMLS
ncbi:MAG: hypothetical protein JSV53_04805 [candidate division WOR-3 bacterium]|nr:MAG: hypothetical protein JSV53_04805 [candidate division WOR-3 bacterium]